MMAISVVVLLAGVVILATLGGGVALLAVGLAKSRKGMWITGAALILAGIIIGGVTVGLVVGQLLRRGVSAAARMPARAQPWNVPLSEEVNDWFAESMGVDLTEDTEILERRHGTWSEASRLEYYYIEFRAPESFEDLLDARLESISREWAVEGSVIQGRRDGQEYTQDVVFEDMLTVDAARYYRVPPGEDRVFWTHTLLCYDPETRIVRFVATTFRPSDD